MNQKDLNNKSVMQINKLMTITKMQNYGKVRQLTLIEHLLLKKL